MLVERGGRRILEAAYGWRDLEARKPLTAQTSFNLQSMTKPVVASLAVKLVEEGTLRLETPLGEAFPGLPADHARVTLRELLSHTAGLTRDYEAGSDGPLDSRERAVELFASIPLRDSLPAEFAYRNLDYAMVKALIEQRTGKAFTALLREKVLAPFAPSLTFEPPPDAAVGYDGLPGHDEMAESVPGESYAGGTLWGSAEALASWEHALDSGKIVAPSWVDTIRTPISGDYGLGWFIYPPGMFYHGGDGDGFQGAMVRYPAVDDLFFVVLCNVRPHAREFWWRTLAMKAIQWLAVGRSMELPPPRAVSRAQASAWRGTYRAQDGDSIVIGLDRDSALVVSAFGADAVTALSAPDSAWRAVAVAANRKSGALGAWLRQAGDTPDTLVDGETAERLLSFLAEYASDLRGDSLVRWDVLGSTRGAGHSVQTFVAANRTTLRLVWKADGVKLNGWGLGGEAPASLAAGPAGDSDLVAFIPNADRRIGIHATSRRAGRVLEISVGGFTARRARPD